jgi:hypothetical protein
LYCLAPWFWSTTTVVLYYCSTCTGFRLLTIHRTTVPGTTGNNVLVPGTRSTRTYYSLHSTMIVLQAHRTSTAYLLELPATFSSTSSRSTPVPRRLQYLYLSTTVLKKRETGKECKCCSSNFVIFPLAS